MRWPSGSGAGRLIRLLYRRPLSCTGSFGSVGNRSIQRFAAVPDPVDQRLRLLTA